MTEVDNTAVRALTEPLTDILAIGVLFWLTDAVLLAARGRGEVHALHLIVALGACSVACFVAVAILRRYRLAMVFLALVAAAGLWLVVFGPALPSRSATAAAIVAIAAAAVLAAWLTPQKFVFAIPLIGLLHHAVITRRMPGVIAIIAALILVAVVPLLFRVFHRKSQWLVVFCAASIVAGIIAGAVLRERLDSRTWHLPPVAQRASSGSNVVLIVIDTLRTDRVGAFGYRARPTSPFLDAFAHKATLFPRAYSSSSWTIPAVASIFTGLPAGAHGTVTGRDALPRRRATIAEALRGAGYFTSGISANFALDDETGFTRGFDRYAVLWRLVRGNRTAIPSIWDDLNAVLINYYAGWIAVIPGWNWKPRAGDVTRKTIAAIDEAPRDRPLFLYVQYVDPHAPCDAISRNNFRHLAADDAFDPKWSLEYDREIRDLDVSLQTLVAGIDARLDPHKTLLIIVADHGEQLGEDGERGHGRNLSEATIRVPLLVRFPTDATSATTNGPFPTSQLFNMMMAAANLPVSAPKTAVANSSIVVGDTFERSVTGGSYKFVQRWQLHPASLVNETLFVLPDEKHNVLAGNAEIASRLRAAAEADPIPRDSWEKMSDEMRAKFRALGYLR